MPCKLLELPYAYDALEPFYDEATVKLHHEVHKAYVDALNYIEGYIEKNKFKGDNSSIEHLQLESDFCGSEHPLHSLFWQNMRPGGGGSAQGILAERITKDFRSFENFKKQFTAAAVTVEGYGWTLLVWSPYYEELEILQAEKHQNLTQWRVIPLLSVDVWEHAYYPKYQDKRACWLEAWWNLVNWDDVLKRFEYYVG